MQHSQEELLEKPQVCACTFKQQLAPSGCYLDPTKLPLLPDEPVETLEDFEETVWRRWELLLKMIGIHALRCLMHQISMGGEPLAPILLVRAPSLHEG